MHYTFSVIIFVSKKFRLWKGYLLSADNSICFNYSILNQQTVLPVNANTVVPKHSKILFITSTERKMKEWPFQKPFEWAREVLYEGMYSDTLGNNM